MENGTYTEGYVEVLGWLTEPQRRLLLHLGQPEVQNRCVSEQVRSWEHFASVLESVVTGTDAELIPQLLKEPDAGENLQLFVLNALQASNDEHEQIQTLLSLAATHWYVQKGREAGAGSGNSGRPRAANAPAPRYTDMVVWAGDDIWCAYDTQRNTYVYVRSASHPQERSPWSPRPPRFLKVQEYGESHWCGYDLHANCWMYIPRSGSEVPQEAADGWVAEAPASEDVEAFEDAPDLDEAVQGLVNAVRSGALRLDHLAAPQRHVGTWAGMDLLGPLAQHAHELDVALAGSGTAARNRSGRAIVELSKEMERLAARFASLDGWPAGWGLEEESLPDEYVRMLRLGCQDLRGAARRLARAPVDADLRKMAKASEGRSETEVRQAMGGLMNFAWAMGQDDCRSETFADPLHSADRLSGLPALKEGCPDLVRAAEHVAEAVARFAIGDLKGTGYDYVLGECQKLLRRYSERLFALDGRWPSWAGGEDGLPAEDPAAFATMMRLGWQVLEAERQELRTFVRWESEGRNANMPKPKSPRNRELARARAAVPRRKKAPVVLPELDELQLLAHDLAAGNWPPEGLAHPLAWVDVWRASPELRGGFPEFRERAAAVARLYPRRASSGEAYKDAVDGLIGVLEAIRSALSLLGSGWPASWESEGRKVPEQSPEVLRTLIQRGTKELRLSAKDLTKDPRSRATGSGDAPRPRARGAVGGAPGRSAVRGPAEAPAAGGRRAARLAARQASGSRRRQRTPANPASAVASVARWLTGGSGRRR